MQQLRFVITYFAFPVHFVSALAIAIYWMNQGGSPGLILAGITIGTSIIVMILERLNPFYESWNRSRGDIGVDAIHVFVSQFLVPKYGEMLLHIALYGLASSLTVWYGGTLWPADWSLWLQLPMALLLGQFFEYWTHRAMHEVPLFWRLHATHHSPGRLYWLNAARFHPLDSIVSLVVSLTPVILLGAPRELVILLGTWVAVHGLYQHCNVRLKLGPLNYIFSMAELHRWHHSLILDEANSNYGNNIIFWDLVFGTFYLPKDRLPGEDIGLSELPNFPTDYWGQLLSPFRWKRVSRIDEVSTSRRFD